MVFGVKEYTEIRKVLNRDKMSETERVLYDCFKKCNFPVLDYVNIVSDKSYDEIQVTVKNTRLEAGSTVKVERWDGNGNPVFVKVINIKGDFIQFDKGYCKFGNNIIWEEEGKKGDRYWQNAHNNIDWDKYYMETNEV